MGKLLRIMPKSLMDPWFLVIYQPFTVGRCEQTIS